MPTDTEVLIEAETTILPPQLIFATERRGFRNVFGTRRTDRTPQISDSEQELIPLGRLLSAQEKVTEAHRQLKTFEAETNRVRGELKRAQNDLADAKQEHTHDLRRAIEREASLWNELVEVRVQVARALDKASGYRRLVGLFLLLLVPVMFWAAANYRQRAIEPGKVMTGIAQGGVNATPAHDFTLDVDRLDHAVNRFRHGSVKDVLSSVHDANAARGISVCSFEWKGGQISLLFGNQPGAGLGTSVTRCADAVEQEAQKNGL